MFFWVLAPCRLVGRWQRFEETYCLHLQTWTLTSTDESTRRQNPEERNHDPHRHENLKSQNASIVSRIKLDGVDLLQERGKQESVFLSGNTYMNF
jgi:hypothetical protein